MSYTVRRPCKATVGTPKYENFGEPCKRPAVAGSDFCARHGGDELTTTPEAMRSRLDHPRQRCTTVKKNGEPCKSWAIHGAFVCKAHGGNLPNVMKKARERMTELLNPALAELQKILTKNNTSDADKLRAIQMILDRGGVPARSEMKAEVEIKPWEGLVRGILTSNDEDIVDADIVPDREQGIPDFDPDKSDETMTDNAYLPRERDKGENIVPFQPLMLGSKNPPRHDR